jgi:hypothetical protein
MKKRIYILAVLAFFAITQYACRKSDKTEIKECDTQNYSTVTANFISTGTGFKFNVAIYSNNTFVRSKSITVAQKTDTVHVAPGTYKFSLQRVTDVGGLSFILNTVDKNVTIAKCGTEILDAGF